MWTLTRSWQVCNFWARPPSVAIHFSVLILCTTYNKLNKYEGCAVNDTSHCTVDPWTHPQLKWHHLGCVEARTGLKMGLVQIRQRFVTRSKHHNREGSVILDSIEMLFTFTVFLILNSYLWVCPLVSSCLTFHCSPTVWTDNICWNEDKTAPCSKCYR